MRIIFKILLFPISLILTIFVGVSGFLVEKCAVLLNIISGILFIGFLASLAQYLFGWPLGEARTSFGLMSTVIVGVAAFLLSPYGLPTLAAWIVGKLDDLNGAIKSI